MDMEKVREIAREHMDKNDMMHCWDHTERVYRLAVKIGEEENADIEVLKIAALLHDTGCHVDRDNHENTSAKIAEDVLDGYDKKDEVIHCIKAHRFSKNKEPETLEAEILQDADDIDALGAVGLARLFVHSGFHKRPVYNGKKEFSQDYKDEGDTSIEHLHKKPLKILENLNTETARKMAENRHEFMEKFLDQFNDEVSGKK